MRILCFILIRVLVLAACVPAQAFCEGASLSSAQSIARTAAKKAAKKIGVARPRYSAECILAAVAWKKKINLRGDVPLPSVRYGSETPAEEFNDAVEPQWGMRPDIVLNVYVFRLNRIYLLDDAAYYMKMGRFVDDSLAHELTHYLQVKYQGITEMDDSDEFEAVAVQTWFRETYMRDAVPAGAPACR